MSKPNLTLLVGAPCAGKTTFSKKQILENTNTLIFNRDALRLMLQNKFMLSSVDEVIISEMILVGIKSALLCGRNVIVDQTNTKLKYLNLFINKFKDIANIQIFLLNPSLETLINRNIERSKINNFPFISEAMITMMHNNVKKLLDSEEFKKLIQSYEYKRIC